MKGRVFGVPALATLAMLAALPSCYSGTARPTSAASLANDAGWKMVRGVPFVRQGGGSDCGAAALSMVLGYWSVPASREDILAQTAPAGAPGIPVHALRAYARARGLQAFVVAGDMGDLLTELGAGRPVLVGVGKPYGNRARLHYEVVIGVHLGKRVVATLDPDAGLQENTFEGFATEWALAQRVTMIVLPPGA